MAPNNVTQILPRVLIVSRRTLRKNKLVDFVGEYHLDLIVKYGAIPVIVPRVEGIHMHLASFEPIHGVLLCEGEDIDPSRYQPDSESDNLSPEELDEIRNLHASDTAIDKEKDSIEFHLANLCLERNIPFLGICRGSQVLNVACGGTLYQDIEKEISRKIPEENRVKHMDYDNYDGHRHKIRVLEDTPLHKWFKDSLEGDDDQMDIMVNSYHHQGVKKLASRFVPMAYAPDGLIEGYYDPDNYKPEEGKFAIGLQFHPERMRRSDSEEFDLPGCPCVYQEFAKAVIAYQKKVTRATNGPISLMLNNHVVEKKRRNVRSYSVAMDIYSAANTSNTVRNAFTYYNNNTVKVNEDKQRLTRKSMDKLSIEQLTDLASFYQTMSQICSQALDQKVHNIMG